jgi:hypothetical protein
VRIKKVTLSAEYILAPELIIAIDEGEKEFALGKLKSVSFKELVRDLKS